MFSISYFFLKFSKKAMAFFEMPGTKTGLSGRSGDERPTSFSVLVECLQQVYRNGNTYK